MLILKVILICMFMFSVCSCRLLMVMLRWYGWLVGCMIIVCCM